LKTVSTALLMATLLASLPGFSQTPTAPAPAAPVRQRPPAFPERPPADPVSVDRGKAVYGVHCTFCHGADARGGSGGPNLIRAQLVLNDKNGELIGPVIREGREGMPKFDLTPTQISDIANFIHSFKVGGYDVSRMTPPTIVTGDPKAGEAYFAKTCNGCHSVTGNLKGISTKVNDPKRLQQTWLMPGGGRGGPATGTPVTVTVTTGSSKVTGRLLRIDDFLVSLVEEDGTPRSFTREGETPKVELIDPLAGHRKLLASYTDKDIHDLTAYLVTIK
jgi:mono/diheme cytochrome c family protein